MGRSVRAGVIAVAVMVGVTACSQTVAGTPTAPEGLDRLDTGNYPTTPRTVVARTAADAWQQEGWLIADAVVAPSDIDPALIEVPPQIDSGIPVFSPQYFGSKTGAGIIGPDQIQSFVGAPFQAGFIASATNSDATLLLRTGILRFVDEATAQRAIAAVVARREGRDDATDAAMARVGATVVWSDRSGRGQSVVTAVSVRGNLVAITSSASDGAHGDRVPDLMTAAMSAQVRALPKYTPTAVRPSDYIPPVPMDRDGMMARTLPATRVEPLYGLSPAVDL